MFSWDIVLIFCILLSDLYFYEILISLAFVYIFSLIFSFFHDFFYNFNFIFFGFLFFLIFFLRICIFYFFSWFFCNYAIIFRLMYFDVFFVFSKIFMDIIFRSSSPDICILDVVSICTGSTSKILYMVWPIL